MSNKVTEYQVLSSNMIDTLNQIVNEAIAQGWTPSGSLVASNGDLVQAMVKLADQ